MDEESQIKFFCFLSRKKMSMVPRIEWCQQCSVQCRTKSVFPWLRTKIFVSFGVWFFCAYGLTRNALCYIAGVYPTTAPLHWLVHGHMTCDDETVSRQTPWAGNIAKTMTSNGKQFTVTREMLTAVARDQSVQLKVAWCCRKILTAFSKFAFVLLCFITNHLMTGHLGNSEFCFPRDQSLSV